MAELNQQLERLVIAGMIAVSTCTASFAAEKQMTTGLTNTRPDGTSGVTYQGGVAGFAGPTQDGSSIAIDVTSPEQLKANADNAKLKAASDRQRAFEEQQEMQKRQRALEQYQAAQREAARVQAKQAREAEQARQNQDTLILRDPPQIPRGAASTGSGGPGFSQQNSGDLATACGAKGFTADFVTGNCISPQGRQTNPQNLYPPFAAPLPKPQPGNLIMRCGAMGRGADFVTGRCM